MLRIPSMEGRSVCLCWEHSNPKGPKGPRGAMSSGGELPREVVPRQTPTETSRSPCVFCTAALCTTATVFMAYIRTLGETPTQPQFSSFIFGVCMILLSPPTQSLSPCWVSVIEDRVLEPRDTISLVKADLGSACARVRSFWISFICLSFYERTCCCDMLGEDSI